MIYICFSCYNEENDLPQLLTTLGGFVSGFGQPLHIIAYDDGSADNTLKILEASAEQLPLTILTGTENKGLGYGIASIMQHLTENATEDDIAIFMDADNTHDINMTNLFLEKIKDGADVVIASRFHPQSVMEGFPLYRRFLSHAAARFFGLILHLPNVRDYTSGFRAYKISAMKDLTDSAKNISLPRGFECQVELLSRFAKSRRIDEVPLVYKYGAKKGASKMRLVRTIRKSVFLGLNLLLKSYSTKTHAA